MEKRKQSGGAARTRRALNSHAYNCLLEAISPPFNLHSYNITKWISWLSPLSELKELYVNCWWSFSFSCVTIGFSVTDVIFTLHFQGLNEELKDGKLSSSPFCLVDSRFCFQIIHIWGWDDGRIGRGSWKTCAISLRFHYGGNHEYPHMTDLKKLSSWLTYRPLLVFWIILNF